jgi:hypothetical protein
MKARTLIFSGLAVIGIWKSIAYGFTPVKDMTIVYPSESGRYFANMLPQCYAYEKEHWPETPIVITFLACLYAYNQHTD